ncbi:YfhD family protein [Ectobacillus panaciterrae]|nr:YfhD family protein [Ectobacillus panaciterrae]
MAKKKAMRNVQSDGRDVEFSQELADQDDLEAQARSQAADARQKKNMKNE